MSEATQAVGIPDEVREYAREKGLEPYLEPLLAAARRHFPQSNPRMAVEYDPEVEGLTYLTIFVRTEMLDIPQYFAAKDGFSHEKLSLLPPALRCEVRLGRGDPP
jgi:hypothetical protein